MNLSEETLKRAMEIQTKRNIEARTHDDTLEALGAEAESQNQDDINERVLAVSELLQACFPTKSQTVFAENGMIDELHKKGGSGDEIEDLNLLWGCDASVREGITEAAYNPQTYNLMRDINNPHKKLDGAYEQLGKLIYEAVDNYLYRIAEDSNK